MKLNREQIKKALECLWYEKECVGDECPLFKLGGDCAPLIAMDALSLIKELTEENERLKADKDYWKNRARESESEYDQAVKRGYNLGTVDSVRSFAERLKAEMRNTAKYSFGGREYSVIGEAFIDQIAKERLKEEENND